MKSKFKHKKLRTRIWLYFILFSVFFVIFIWLLQTLFFEYSYRRERGNTILTSGELIYSSIVEENEVAIPDNYVLSLKETGIDVVVITKSGDVISFLYPMQNPITITDFNYDIYDKVITAVNVSQSQNPVSSVFNDESVMYYGRRIDLEGNDAYLILTSETNTLSDVVKTLRNQLIITAVIAIIASFFLSYIIAGRLSAPIDNMSKVANSWAHGNDDVQFEGADYQEINELATALNFAKDEKSKAELLQRDLLANITHDLKTPLTMIKAYAEKIRDLSGNVKEKRDKDTEVIIEETDRLTLLVNDILNLSKLQSFVDAPEKTVFNLSELTENVIYRFSQALNDKGYILLSNIEQNVYVEADEKKIEEVLYNLIGNSINYTGEDKTVKVYLSSTETYATLEILDSGKGIDKDNLDGIWEKYLRYSETHQRAVKGTGLGLSIVKTILDAHNFKYGVISKKDTGSNFFVKFIPVKITPNEEVETNG